MREAQSPRKKSFNCWTILGFGKRVSPATKLIGIDHGKVRWSKGISAATDFLNNRTNRGNAGKAVLSKLLLLAGRLIISFSANVRKSAAKRRLLTTSLFRSGRAV